MRNRRQRTERTTPQTTKLPAGNDLGMALDALNAWGSLELWKETDLKSITSFGPGIFRGYLPHSWTGVVLWYKQRGYYHYSTLYLIGVWALRLEEQIRIVIGTRELTYAHPLFNAEGYHRRMQTEFHTFYQDDGHPPADYRYSEVYEPTRRLAMRQAIEQELKAWAAKPL